MKTLTGIYSNPNRHWVGDGFPVRSLFSYNTLSSDVSPFLLLDFAGPAKFEPTDPQRPRGVGQHPHRGFETVTIVYDGEVAHKDSMGQGGVIGKGDVQWMTAASGILHEEFHSPEFSRAGGDFKMIQLWVNLPAKDKMGPPSYQGITAADIETVELDGGAGEVRVIAGDFNGTEGAATTFTPINMWDVHLKAGAVADLPVPNGHNTSLVVVSGSITVNGSETVSEAEMALMSQDGEGVVISASDDAVVLVLTGEPIDEPIAGQGPFVMNTPGEIRQAISDFNSGQFGNIA